jgi:hypothetical protein
MNAAAADKVAIRMEASIEMLQRSTRMFRLPPKSIHYLSPWEPLTQPTRESGIFELKTTSSEWRSKDAEKRRNIFSIMRGAPRPICLVRK